MTGRPTPVPSNARRAPHASVEREWDRRDTSDEPLPFDWREMLDPRLWFAALVLLAGLVAFSILMIAVLGEPPR